MFMLNMNGMRLDLVLVQFRLPVGSKSKPISLPSVPELFAGPAATVKSRRGLFVPASTEAWAAICGLCADTLPPPSEFALASQGASLPELNVMLLLNVLKLF